MPADGGIECAVLCLTKVVLFVVTVLFVLYLPMGDPHVVCHERNHPQGGITCMCKIYHAIFSAADKTLHTLDTLLCMAINALYEGKLQVYSALSTYDKKDFCRFGCCDEGYPEKSLLPALPALNARSPNNFLVYEMLFIMLWTSLFLVPGGR